jgi:hypothetical protein
MPGISYKEKPHPHCEGEKIAKGYFAFKTQDRSGNKAEPPEVSLARGPETHALFNLAIHAKMMGPAEHEGRDGSLEQTEADAQGSVRGQEFGRTFHRVLRLP